MMISASLLYGDVDTAVAKNDSDRATAAVSQGFREEYKTDDGVYQFTIDTTRTPEVADWTRKILVPVVKEWYPRLVRLLPGKGFDAPREISITFQKLDNGTPAYASGNRITCNIDWFMKNLKGEAAGAVVHEMVHVVQSYGRARRNNSHAARTPGWLMEGIADYVRWYIYEPQSRGAEIGRKRAPSVRYDNSYRVTANFLNWVVEKYDKELVIKLNAACREGKYSESLWKKYTGHAVQELGDQWKAELAK